MFDGIYFDESPFPEDDVRYFQTKSLDNCMEQYRVSKDKEFQVSEYKMREPTEEEQQEINGMKLPLAIKQHVKWADTDITGTLEAHNKVNNIWYSIQIIVIYGKVVKITTHKVDLPNDN